jgi:hypothetical protein
MTSSNLTPAELAAEILNSHDDISPLFDDVVTQIRRLRECGLPDEKIRKTVPGMYRLQKAAAETGGLSEPASEEIRVIALPKRYQRADWS